MTKIVKHTPLPKAKFSKNIERIYRLLIWAGLLWQPLVKIIHLAMHGNNRIEIICKKNTLSHDRNCGEKTICPHPRNVKLEVPLRKAEVGALYKCMCNYWLNLYSYLQKKYFISIYSIYLAPGGGCEVLFSPGLSVCVSVCLCVCPANILVFYGSKVKVTGTVYCFLKVVISQKLSHRKISIFFHRHLLGYSIRWNNKNSSE